MKANMILKPESEDRREFLILLEKFTSFSEVSPEILNVEKLLEGLKEVYWVKGAEVSEDGTILIEAKDKKFVHDKLTDSTSLAYILGWQLYNYPEMTKYDSNQSPPPDPEDLLNKNLLIGNNVIDLKTIGVKLILDEDGVSVPAVARISKKREVVKLHTLAHGAGEPGIDCDVAVVSLTRLEHPETSPPYVRYQNWRVGDKPGPWWQVEKVWIGTAEFSGEDFLL